MHKACPAVGRGAVIHGIAMRGSPRAHAAAAPRQGPRSPSNHPLRVDLVLLSNLKSFAGRPLARQGVCFPSSHSRCRPPAPDREADREFAPGAGRCKLCRCAGAALGWRG